MREITTVRFGKIAIDKEDIIRFKDGLPGFPEEKEFILIPLGENEPFLFMQSLMDADLAFFITNPFIFFKDYEFVLSDEVLEELDIKAPEDFCVYSILSMTDKNIQNMTANLVAPVIIQNKTKEARQVILEKTSYTTREGLFHGQSAERGR